MCIVLCTTTHPSYSLILISNRDEYVLRPTSRPRWWKHPATNREILSSRDLYRPERGTWLGITRDGRLAALTNYREPAADEAAVKGQDGQPIYGVKSRGAMPVEWLAGLPPHESVREGVDRLVTAGDTKGVGGFSMICAKLRRRWRDEGIAIVSNRADVTEEVPVVGCASQGETWGLSNAVFSGYHKGVLEWPKVSGGKILLKSAVKKARADGLDRDALIERLFQVLDTKDILPGETDIPLPDMLKPVRHSIFISLGGDEAHRRQMDEARARGPATWDDNEGAEAVAAEASASDGFSTGLYGTQRQTVMLVGLEGKVSVVERVLWDPNGNAIPRGEGDVRTSFDIDGWDDV